MNSFKFKQAIIIFYLCLMGISFTSEVVAEPRWNNSQNTHQGAKRNFNGEKHANDYNHRREFSNSHKRQSQSDDGNKPAILEYSKDSNTSHAERWKQEKNRLVQQHYSDRDNDDNSYNREKGKHQTKSQQPQDSKDRNRSRDYPKDEKQRRHSSSGNTRNDEHRKHEHIRKDRAVVSTNKTHYPQHRPKYNLYQRHQHIYYRTPWYNTYYFAPIHYHFHPIGYRVNVLPNSYVKIVVGGFPYFYLGGIYYRAYNSGYIVVSAPIGAVVTTLPVGFFAFSIGVMTYYYVNDTYYVWDEPREAYMVVEKPEGADQAIADATAERLFVYPKQGQSEEQQAKDRYECHRWAVTASRVDPTLENETYTNEQKQDYQRAMAACLEGRGYTVK